MAKSEKFIKELPDKAWEYIQECIKNTKEFATGSGKVVKIKDRHIPTIDYFLRVWLPMNWGDAITRETWYTWLNQKDDEGQPSAKSDTIKVIDDLFKSVATDIVANEGKGIFYAKNRLGMTDKMKSELNVSPKILNIDPLDDE